MTINGSDLAAKYVATEDIWLEVTATGSPAEQAEQIKAARDYVQAIDAYLARLKGCGRQVPHHLDVVADTLRKAYLETPRLETSRVARS
jgi:hypothetical protein